MNEITTEILLENLMRGLAARLGQLMEVVITSVGYNLLVFGACLYAFQLLRSHTRFDSVLALYVIAASLVMAAKGADLIHQRKWAEYVKIERVSEAKEGAIENPSIDVSRESKKSVLVINILAVATLGLTGIVIGSFQIWAPTSPITSLLLIVPQILIAAYSGWKWAEFSASK